MWLIKHGHSQQQQLSCLRFLKAVSWSLPSLSDMWIISHPQLTCHHRRTYLHAIQKFINTISSLGDYNLLQNDRTSLDNWYGKWNLLLNASKSSAISISNKKYHTYRVNECTTPLTEEFFCNYISSELLDKLQSFHTFLALTINSVVLRIWFQIIYRLWGSHSHLSVLRGTGINCLFQGIKTKVHFARYPLFALNNWQQINSSVRHPVNQFGISS